MKAEAGRELDREIAEKVMGLKVQEDAFFISHGRFTVATGDRWISALPKYSTSIEDAFKVHKHLGRLMRLTDFGPFAWHCEFLAVQPGQVDVEAKAETAPLAICVAAIRAVESNEKEGELR
jgi:hypothetical protein